MGCRLDLYSGLAQVTHRITPVGELCMYRVVMGDTPAEGLSDFDPVVQLLWVDGDGIECETVFVGAIARTVGRVLDSASLAEGARCQGLLVPFSQSSLFLARAAGARHRYEHAVTSRPLDRLRRTLSDPWRKISQRARHWVTGA